MKRSRIVYLTLSLVVSIVLIAVLFSRVDLADYVRTLAGVSLPALLAYMAFNLAGTALRAWRYRILLAPVPIGWRDIFLVTFIRNSFDDLLPARIGSLSYIYVLTGRLGRPFENVASSFVVAFVFDFLTLGPFLALAAAAAGFGAGMIPASTLLILAAIVFLAFAAVVWKIVPLSAFAVRIYGLLLAKTDLLGKPWAARSSDKAAAAVESLRSTERRRIYGPLFGLSLLIRLAKYASLFVLFGAVLQGHGIAFRELSFWMIILALTGAELTSVLPIKGLAGFGTWESAWAAALQLMGFDPRLAVLSGLAIHLITNLFEYSLGLGSILWLAVRRKSG